MNKNYFDIQKWYWLVDYIQKLPDDYSSLPVTLRIDLTTDCNFSCPYCLYQSKVSVISKDDKYTYPSISKLDQEKLLLTIDKFAKRGLKSVIITGGGEPTIYPGFNDVLDRLFANKIQVGLITNGTQINDKFINRIQGSDYMQWIRVSLDSFNPETWNRMHRPNDDSTFDNVIANIKSLANLENRKFLVAINFLITPVNYNEIEDAFLLAKKLGVDNIRFTPVFTKQGGETYKGIKEKIDAQLKVVMKSRKPLVQVNLPRFEFMDTPNHTERCWFSSFSVNLGVDSHLYPCCLKKYVKGMGTSLSPETFDEDMDKYFKKMSEFDARSCKDCMYHKFNDYAFRVSSPGRLDNFIP